jgi:adenylate kinase
LDSEKHFIIIGAPGSGKGTMAVRIAEKLGLRHLSTGDLLREAVTKQSELGRRAEEYMNSGALVPDEIIVELLHEELEEHGYGNWILDGFPRNLHQAEMLEKMLHENGADLDRVFLLDLDMEIIVLRLTNRRVCPVCNTIYNLVSPEFIPKVEGKCDKDGADLIRRKDDEEETIRNRLSVYEKQTAPVIEHFRELGLLETVDGAGGVENITAELIRLAT